MDNASNSSPCRFGTDPRLTALTGVLAVVAGALAAATPDRAGRLLFGLAAVVLAGYALGDVLRRPRLEADARGVTIRTLTATIHVPWNRVDRIEADVRNRLGLRSVTLEIDAAEQLFVFSRRALGTDPERAAARLRAARGGSASVTR